MIRFLQTPSAVKKFVLGAILTLICLSMVIFLIPGIGVGDYFGAGPAQAGIYATVGDEQVTTAEIQRRAQNTARQQNIPPQFLSFILPQVAQQLVLQKAMMVEAHRLGLTVTDEELRDELHHGMFAAELYPNGQWVGQEKYDGFTQQLGFSIPDFERALKDELLLRKLDSMVQAGAVASDDEVQKAFIREFVQVKFDYAVVTADAIAKQLRPTDPELRKFYQDNLQRIQGSVPEQRKVKYAVVDLAKLAAQVQPTAAELERYYNDHREQFRVEDQVNVRHILVKTPANADAKATEAARAKADGLLKQLQGGADFAALAKKSSDDTGSGENGGSLGWIGRGRTVPEFEQAAFGLPKGQMSGLVRTQFGFHILKVDDKRAAHQQTLAEVQAQIAPLVAQEKVQKTAEDLANRTLLTARTAGLDAAAAKSGLNVVATDFFPANAKLPGLGDAPEFMAAVFSAAEKSPPALAKVEQGYAIFQLEAVKPPATPSFEQVRAQLEAQYREQRSQALLGQKTQELADRAHALHNLKQAAKEIGADFKTSELVGAASQVPDVGALSKIEQVFDMKPGEISGPVPAGNNRVVLGLVERQEPTPAEYAAKRDEIREAVLRVKRDAALGLFADRLRDRMEKDGKIKYNPIEKEKLTKGTTLGS